MSEAYEAVITVGDLDTVYHTYSTLSSPLKLGIGQLNATTFAMYRQATRNEQFQPAKVERITAIMSVASGKALAIFYDNSCEVRTALLYEHGERVRSFDVDDEVWVMIDEQGEPRKDGPAFQRTELAPNEEYEIIISAVDAGLDALGVRSPLDGQKVRQAICYEFE